MKSALYSAGSKTSFDSRLNRDGSIDFRFYGAESYIDLPYFMESVLFRPQKVVSCFTYHYSKHFKTRKN